MDQDGTWHGGGPRFRPHCARWGPSSPPAKRGQRPQFSAHFCCCQTAGCIKMPLGTEVGLIPGEFVLDGDPATPYPKGGRTPQFAAHVYCGWMDHDSTWDGGGPRSWRHCARWDPAPVAKKGGRASNFRPIFIVAKRLAASRCHLVWR